LKVTEKKRGVKKQIYADFSRSMMKLVDLPND